MTGSRPGLLFDSGSHKFFADRSHYKKECRPELIPFLRPFWKEDPHFTDEKREAIYGEWSNKVTILDNPSDAVFGVLPMSWNYYLEQQHVPEAVRFMERCQEASLPLISWCSGDFGVPPLNKRAYVFRLAGYRSKRLPLELGLPAFFDDPLKKYFGRDQPFVRNKTDIPVVGFCGQAYSPFYKSVFDVLRTLWRNGKYKLGLSYHEPQTIYPAGLRRKNVLNILEQSGLLTTNFIKRKAYRAGAVGAAQRAKTELEYFQNMIDSDYVVCMRGNGNFSVRLYETLAMGRIPVIVDTDCLYPWDNKVNWRELGVWIDRSELSKLPERITQFHASMTVEEFRKRQEHCRMIWSDFLSMSGFFSTLLTELFPRAEMNTPI